MLNWILGGEPLTKEKHNVCIGNEESSLLPQFPYAGSSSFQVSPSMGAVHGSSVGDVALLCFRTQENNSVCDALKCIIA